jgi:FkbM family methyltransferase
MKHHPIFAKFRGYSGSLPVGVSCDWIGSLYRPEWLPLGHVQSGFPILNEEYFEWIDLLEAVTAARGRFVMLELGAGFGRWGTRGALAARQRGIRDRNIEIRFVEAEPQHAAWLRDALALNGLGSIQSSVIEAAVAKEDGQVFFAIGHEREWYGQSITFEGAVYFSALNLPDVKVVPMRAISLSTVLTDLDRVDLIDMDIQGEELDVVSAAIDDLNAKVGRMHIETHSKEIDSELPLLLSGQGWERLYAYPCSGPSETPFGLVNFIGGQQGWVNPRLRKTIKTRIWRKVLNFVNTSESGRDHPRA